MAELGGKTALVTGSTSGIGRAIAAGLAQAALTMAGRIDILVNNAGVFRPAPTLAVDGGTPATRR